jgi:hypothetical protein
LPPNLSGLASLDVSEIFEYGARLETDPEKVY